MIVHVTWSSDKSMSVHTREVVPHFNYCSFDATLSDAERGISSTSSRSHWKAPHYEKNGFRCQHLNTLRKTLKRTVCSPTIETSPSSPNVAIPRFYHAWNFNITYFLHAKFQRRSHRHVCMRKRYCRLRHAQARSVHSIASSIAKCWHAWFMLHIRQLDLKQTI